MDPCSFVRILVGDMTIKFPTASSASFAVRPSSSPCFYKIKLTNFQQQSAVAMIISDEDAAANGHSLSACFNLNKPQIETLASKRSCLKISIFTGRALSRAKLLGRVVVPLSKLGLAESRPVVYQNGWVVIGGKKNGNCASLLPLALPPFFHKNLLPPPLPLARPPFLRHQ